MAGIFRFANAASDIRKFIQTYKTIYNEFHAKPGFKHDDVIQTLIKNGLVSSSGAIGQVALARSTRTDRTRDPLFNQIKMYSEIYRMLGWYIPGLNRSTFEVPEYGAYISDADGTRLRDLFELNIIHIVSPNPLVEIRGRNVLRPFPMILKILDKADGIIHRDEIILTVLACASDRDSRNVDEASERILSIRGNADTLEREYENLMADNNLNSKAVLRNYTRFIMATLSWLDYAQPIRMRNIYGSRPVKIYKQTEVGSMKAKQLESCVDIRNSDLVSYSLEERAAFTLYSIFFHLEKLGYDLSSYTALRIRINSISKTILDDTGIRGGRDFLYFGYQESSREEKDFAESLIA
jgi:hypothetical protein